MAGLLMTVCMHMRAHPCIHTHMCVDLLPLSARLAATWLFVGLLLLLCNFIVVAFGLASLPPHCLLQLSSVSISAGLLYVLVPGCCWAYSVVQRRLREKKTLQLYNDRAVPHLSVQHNSVVPTGRRSW